MTDFLYLGCTGSIEQDLAARLGLPFQAIRAGGLRGQRAWTAAWHSLQLAVGIAQAWQAMRRFRPQAALVTGGYVSVPVVMAATLRRVPVLIYLPDVVPGQAIQRLARRAARVAVSFAETLPHFAPGQAVVTGYPVRAEFFQVDRRAARQRLGLAQDQAVVVVFGGSRGAHSLNAAVSANLAGLVQAAQLLHICGPTDVVAAQADRARLPEDQRARYRAWAYLHEDMAQALGAADLVVARAGASTLGEFPALGLPSILVPYPYSGQHQDANADYLVSRGAALKIADADLTRELLAAVRSLLLDPDRLDVMRQHALALCRPDAAARIAAELSQLAGGT